MRLRARQFMIGWCGRRSAMKQQFGEVHDRARLGSSGDAQREIVLVSPAVPARQPPSARALARRTRTGWPR